MIQHVLFTGEVGSGKSTALRRTLALLGMQTGGLETYSPEPRGVRPKRLLLRAYGSNEEGTLVCMIPGEDRSQVAPLFDMLAVRLLEAAQRQDEVVVIDEIGRLERDAHAYHAALKACLDGEKPVLGVIRKQQAAWADWIRAREDVLLLEVTPDNRDALPQMAAEQIRRSIAAPPDGVRA
ncbi:MAG: hypothetical protein IKU38_03935 [Clostridia bacterium]|nr:hypothetical protein [Clostridia bacterium]